MIPKQAELCSSSNSILAYNSPTANIATGIILMGTIPTGIIHMATILGMLTTITTLIIHGTLIIMGTTIRTTISGRDIRPIHSRSNREGASLPQLFQEVRKVPEKSKK